jgi:hypothetical protein
VRCSCVIRSARRFSQIPISALSTPFPAIQTLCPFEAAAAADWQLYSPLSLGGCHTAHLRSAAATTEAGGGVGGGSAAGGRRGHAAVRNRATVSPRRPDRGAAKTEQEQPSRSEYS